jgi:hypothetical protein
VKRNSNHSLCAAAATRAGWNRSGSSHTTCCKGQPRNHRARACDAAIDVGRDQIVLATEVAVERGLGCIGFGQDAIDAHGADTFCVEEAIGGIEQPVTHCGLSGFRSRHG